MPMTSEPLLESRIHGIWSCNVDCDRQTTTLGLCQVLVRGQVYIYTSVHTLQIGYLKQQHNIAFDYSTNICSLQFYIRFYHLHRPQFKISHNKNTINQHGFIQGSRRRCPRSHSLGFRLCYRPDGARICSRRQHHRRHIEHIHLCSKLG